MLTTAERQKIIASYLKTSSGRMQLAQSMVQPLRNYRDYEAVGRRAFMVDELQEGALPYYDKDVDTTAFVIGEEGQDVVRVAKGDRVFVPLFEIAANPMIPMTQIKQRRYDVESRVKTKVKTDIFKQEDIKIFGLFDAMVTSVSHPNAIIPIAAADVTIDHFSLAMSQIESWGNVRAARVFMNQANMKILRKVGKDYFDPATTNELLKTGFIGTIFGMEIHTSPVIPTDKIYFTAESEFFGFMPIMQDLMVLAADDPKTRQIGFSVWIQEGILVHNPKGLSAIHIT